MSPIRGGIRETTRGQKMVQGELQTQWCLLVYKFHEYYSYGPSPVISTYNPIYRMYNPIEITSYNS